MADESFGTWWPCLRKHYKRLNVWLPRAKELFVDIDGTRNFRYFTLCARPMIDVYMLVREKILQYDPETRRVDGVSFCECEEKIFPEMTEMIGVEEAGFLARLEELVLFKDSPETETLETDSDLVSFAEEAGEGLDPVVRRAVEQKRKYLLFRELFPFDFLNLDFCDRYYGDPPDVMKIHATLDRILEWQRQPGRTPDGTQFSVPRFVVAITCRVDSDTPQEAIRRLKNIVESNSRDHQKYKEALSDREVGDIRQWPKRDLLDFFMSAWPKEIARMASQKQWDINIHDHAYYSRRDRSGGTYDMVCLIAEFAQTNLCTTYLSAAMRCLDKEARLAIPTFDPSTGQGVKLAVDLKSIVDLRNKQANAFAREPLPDPSSEIVRLRKEGVAI